MQEFGQDALKLFEPKPEANRDIKSVDYRQSKDDKVADMEDIKARVMQEGGNPYNKPLEMEIKKSLESK